MDRRHSAPGPNLASQLDTVLQTAPLYKVEDGNKSLIATFPKTTSDSTRSTSTYAWLIDCTSRSRNYLYSDNEKLVVDCQVVSSLTSNESDSALIQIYYSHKNMPVPTSLKVQVNVAGNTKARISEWTPVKNAGTPSSVLLTSVLVPEFKTDQCIIRELVFRNTIKVMIKLDHSFQGGEERKLENAFVTTKNMYDKKLFADVEICVKKTREDGIIVEKKIMMHKAVIAARSSVFTAMLESNFVENQLSVVEIVDFEPRVVEELFKFLYVGEIDLENNAVDLLKIADKYDIPELMKTCQEYISQHIPKLGWNCIFELLHLYNGRVPILREKVKQYYLRYETTLKKSPDFQAAAQLFSTTFFEMYFS